MDVTTTQAAAANASATTTTSATASADSEARSVISSDFETFLKMLTAQARYQDPLEPLDSSEYAAQLAQFSSVEQQVMTNDLLNEMMSQLASSNMAQLASWIGMEARTTAGAKFDGSPITIVPSPASAAEEMDLVVFDAAGQEVQRKTLPVSKEPVQWAGVGKDGEPFADGVYTFKIESRTDGKVVSTTAAEAYSKVTEVRTQGNGTVLILAGGTAVPASSVSALRQAG